MRGSAVRKSAKERLKELSFPALKLSALIAKGKKIIVANPRPLSTPNIVYSEVLYTLHTLSTLFLFILLNFLLVLSSYIKFD